VVLHKEWARRYYAIDEYVNAAKQQITNTIFLLTDDDNAVQEARAKFPGHNWVVVDRPRYKGKEGGWENHIPSDDPKQEVIVLMAIFRKVQLCDVFVHTRSNLADYITGAMLSSQPRLHRFDLNSGQSNAQIYRAKNSETHKISQTDWKRGTNASTVVV
jgi:hypothetical protein